MTKIEVIYANSEFGASQNPVRELVTEVSAGEEIVITRHGQPVARLCGMGKLKSIIAPRDQFRANLPRLEESSVSLIRSMREEAR